MTARKRRNAARLVGLALVGVSLLLLGGSGSAGADGSGATLAAKGWWWEAQQAGLPSPLPPPPNVKPGQLDVQGAPTDERGSAYAALRFTLGSTTTAQSLTLPVAENGDSGAPAVLLACRTGSAWTPAEAGPYSSGPQVDTKACVNGNKSTDGKGWTFAVGPLQTGTVLDIAIVPGVDPNTKKSTPFSIVFDAPSASALTTVVGDPPPTIPPSPTGFNAGAATETQTGGATSTFHPAPSVPPVATGLPADKLGETATSPTKQAASQPGLNTALAASPADKARDKRIGYVVLAMAAAIGLYAWRQDNLMAMNGGALPGAPDEPGGLGRFARPRQGQPPALT